MSFIVEQLS